MIGLACSVFDGRENVLSLQERIVGENLVDGGAGGKQLEHIRHANAIAANAGAATALSFLDRDSVEALNIHRYVLR